MTRGLLDFRTKPATKLESFDITEPKFGMYSQPEMYDLRNRGGGRYSIHLAERSICLLKIVLAKALECPTAGRACPRHHG